MTMETILSLGLGLGLAAACGFRVFVPLLVMSVASHAGHLDLAAGFDWIGSTPALVAFAVATLLEVTAYYVPWLDALLDTVAVPAAVVAGIVVTASAVGDVSPMLRWGLAVIAGGGVAATVQAATTVARQISTWTTFGLGNPIVATVEAAGAVGMSLAAMLAPLFAAFLVVGGVVLAGGLLTRRALAVRAG
jgi:hypothetical protein